MKTWVVTGGAGSGKSSFARMLQSVSGTEMVSFSCDEVARHLWGDREVVSRISQALSLSGGDKDPMVAIERKKVRDLVFRNPVARGSLEAIMHPLILAELELARELAQKEAISKVFLAEVPLYYEIQASITADTVIVVAASRTVQSTRLIEHRQLDAMTCEGLLNAQSPLEEKTKKADVVVWNDGSLAALEAQALSMLRARWEIPV